MAKKRKKKRGKGRAGAETVAAVETKRRVAIKRRRGPRPDFPGFTFTSVIASPKHTCKDLPKRKGNVGRCPVQLLWVKGKPRLRFCRTPGAPGFIVKVSDPDEALEIAHKACACWKRSAKSPRKRSFDRCEVAKRARKDFPRSKGLGKAKRR